MEDFIYKYDGDLYKVYTENKDLIKLYKSRKKFKMQCQYLPRKGQGKKAVDFIFHKDLISQVKEELKKANN